MRASIITLAALTIVAATAVSPVANASPSLAIRVYDDGVLVSGLSGSQPAGSALSISGSSTDFSLVTALSTGFPLVAQPAFTAQTTSISTNSGFSGSHVIRIEFTQTDVSSASAGGMAARLASSFTDNFLVGAGITNVLVANYASASDTSFGQTILLGSITDTAASGPTGSAGPIFTSLSLPNALFSETSVIQATFTAPGSVLQASAQINAVPEPASMGLLGAGLLGAGMIRRKRSA